MSDNDVYTYEPLNDAEKQIRLLRLERGAFDEPIRGSLIVVSLNELDQWELGHSQDWFALSYVWGSDERNESIDLSGKRAFVTPTLHQALPFLRHADHKQYWWIDQICINQDDTAERSSQVQFMSLIYTRASLVTGWLGHGQQEIEDTLRLVQDLQNEISVSLNNDRVAMTSIDDGGYSKGVKMLLKILRPDIVDISHEQVEVFCKDLSQKFDSLFNMPWFERVWTLQEAVLPKNLNLQAGRTVADWDGFMDFTCIPEIKDIRRRDLNLEDHNMYVIQSLRVLPKPPIIGDYLPWTFAMNHLQRQTSNHRDYVYGLLGLLTHNTMDILRPDYSLSVEDVFISGTLALIQADEGLGVLGACCAHREGGSYKLPSWCPDWSDWKLGCGIRDDSEGTTMIGLYNASLAYPPRLSLSSRSGHMQISGFMLDELSHVCCNIGLSQTSSMHDSWDMISGELGHAEHLSESKQWSHALVRALINDTFDMEYRASPPDISNATSFFDDLDDDSESSARRARAAKEIGFRYERLAESIASIIKGYRSLFRTKTGRIGKSCKHIQRGDKLCILYGGRLPFILRAIGSVNRIADNGEKVIEQGYELIGGECYVDGLVDGWVLRLAKEHNIPDQTFCLV